jgi:hypothetical protein
MLCQRQGKCSDRLLTADKYYPVQRGAMDLLLFISSCLAPISHILTILLSYLDQHLWRMKTGEFMEEFEIGVDPISDNSDSSWFMLFSEQGNGRLLVF